MASRRPPRAEFQTAIDRISIISPAGGALAAGAGDTLGWTFSTNADLRVTHLGFIDLQTDGLNVPHTIAIWDENENLLTSAVIPAGQTTERLGDYRYIPITPIILPKGATWTIGATVPITQLDAPPESVVTQIDLYPFKTNVDPADMLFNPNLFVVRTNDRFIDPT